MREASPEIFEVGPSCQPSAPPRRLVAASIAAAYAVFVVMFQRRRPEVEPAAAAWCRCPRVGLAAAAFIGA